MAESLSTTACTKGPCDKEVKYIMAESFSLTAFTKGHCEKEIKIY